MRRVQLAAIVLAASSCFAVSAFAADDRPAAPQVQIAVSSQDADGSRIAAPAASDAPAESSAPSAPQAPETTADASTPAAAPVGAVQGPLLVYVKHTKAPVLIDTTAGSAAFALVGSLAAISAGHSIVVNNDIEDPSAGIAHEVAAAYAAAHGGRVADAPVLDDHLWTRAKGDKLAEQAAGANLVVDVEPPGMNLIYFPLDWTHYDLMFLDRVRIIDASDGKVIATAKCFLKPAKADAKTHSELLADKAAGLKQLIVAKSEACAAKLKADLKL